MPVAPTQPVLASLFHVNVSGNSSFNSFLRVPQTLWMSEEPRSASTKRGLSRRSVSRSVDPFGGMISHGETGKLPTRLSYGS